MDEKIDSRILKTSMGFGGVVHPNYWIDGRHQQVYCINCGKTCGWATIPDDGLNSIIYICGECEDQMGEVPLQRANIPEPVGEIS